MQIVELTAENIKRLKAVSITPDGPVQIVAGRNAQGKSSVLDSIWMALKWKAAGKDNAKPVRDGEDKGKVILDLGDYIVTRTWDAKKGTSAIMVETPDGTPQQRPQEILDGLVGSLSFDPLAFTQQGDREQVQTLLQFVSLSFDPDKMAVRRQELYDKRHAVGQDKTRAKGALESMALPDPDLPAEEVSTAILLGAYQAAQDEITRHNDVRRALDDAMRVHTDTELGVMAARAALTAAMEKNGEALNAMNDAGNAVNALGQAPELGPIKDSLATAEATNAAIRAARDYRTKKAELDAFSAEWAELDEAMDHLDKTKADALAAATFPIDGLGFDDDGVTYNGVPFNQASGAEKLRVSLALAMAMNPSLRVIRITDGSLLDEENMALIEQMATDADFQVWIERVGSSATGVVIEDGKVV